MIKRILYIIAIALSILACTDDIDKSNRFTFTGETVADFLLNRSDKYSHFITLLKRAELFSLLQTYGQYTLFLPDNSAIEKFVQEQDSIYHATKDSDSPVKTGVISPLVEELSDSMANIIARSHIVEARYPMAEMSDGTLHRRNLNLRSLGISYKVIGEQFCIMINNRSAIVDGDNEVENGVVHVIDKVINPASKSVPGLIEECRYFSLFSAALKETGLQDSLQLDRDDSYVPIDYNALGFGNTLFPRQNIETKFFRYTAFVETDDVFNAAGIYTLDDLKAFAEKWYGTEERGNYKSPRNALNKFVSYHLVERELAYNDIIFYNFTYNDRYNHSLSIRSSEELMVEGFDRYDYFETMQGTLMKVTKPLSTPKGADIFINYSKREIPYNYEMHRHVNVRIIPQTEFCRMREEYMWFTPIAHNGIINPIDKVLVYNEDEMAGNILNERMRFDFATLLPELSCNKIRYNPPVNDFLYFVPYNYSRNLRYNVHSPLLYRVGAECYFGDTFGGNGEMDLSVRLPHLPPRTYEIRIMCEGIESVVQAYIDGEITGIPFTIYTLPSNTGYVPDAETEDNGLENDKLMRNRNWMKLPDTYRMVDGTIARDASHHARRILTRKYLGEGDHWLRIKSVDEMNEVDIDYIELVPLHIISDPLKPEDRH